MICGWEFAGAADYLGPRQCVTSLRLVDMHILVGIVLFKNHILAWFGSSCWGPWRCYGFFIWVAKELQSTYFCFLSLCGAFFQAECLCNEL